MSKPTTPLVPISWGELIDKITILEIKAEKISSPLALININRELSQLVQIFNNEIRSGCVMELRESLKELNLKLWLVEDNIREKEASREFDQQFIEYARSVYKLNDVRAKLKQSINRELQSELIEEKSYKEFNPNDGKN
jgi:hypothetical protein